MAHDFARSMMDGYRGRFFLGTGTGLLLSVFASRWIYGDGLQFSVISMVAALFLGTPLVFQAGKEVARCASDMNELAALGVIATFASGRFVTSGLISFVMLLAAMLERRSARGARDSLEALLELRPPVARVQSQDGGWEEVGVELLSPGHRVMVKPGEIFPVDGVILDGESAVNQSTITGESMPVDKGPGDSIYAGTVNLTGPVVCEVGSIGEDTALGKVQSLISQAEKTKTPVMRIIDRHVRWYVPAIMLMAGAVLFVTRDLDRAVAMVVVACPCSILLSCPTAIVASLGSAARMGILIKDVAQLETAEKIDSMVFDKTGTVTTGELRVVEVASSDGWSDGAVLAVAAGLERHSTHPVALSVCRRAAETGEMPKETRLIREHHGRGISGLVDGRPVAVGKRAWIEELGIPISSGDPFPGRSVLAVAVDRRLVGEIVMEDGIRDGLQEALTDLRAQGVENIVLLSGDRESVVKRVGGIMEASDCRWDMLPHDKMEYVEAAIENGATVGVVGDGINDGPALSAGSLSIAMGSAGSDVAISSSAIALMNDDIRKVPMVLRLARTTLGVIRQNLLVAFGSIGISLILGAMGVIHPVAAALLHGGTSLAVVLNSARLMKLGEAA